MSFNGRGRWNNNNNETKRKKETPNRNSLMRQLKSTVAVIATDGSNTS